LVEGRGNSREKEKNTFRRRIRTQWEKERDTVGRRRETQSGEGHSLEK